MLLSTVHSMIYFISIIMSHNHPFVVVKSPPEYPNKALGCKMSHCEERNGQYRLVLDGDNPQDYAEWETEVKVIVKSKLGSKSLEHFQGRHNYTLSEVRVNGKYARTGDKTSARTCGERKDDC